MSEHDHHEHKKHAHIAFDVIQQIQILIEEACNGDFVVLTKINMPGSKPEVTAVCKTLTEAEVYMESIVNMFKLNVIENSNVDVMELEKGRKNG